MKESFIFGGKIYISARRASEISEYNSDYIGQLCRSNKLDSRMVGRSWYVTEESIRTHRNHVIEEEVYRNRFENLRRSKTARATVAVQNGNGIASTSRNSASHSMSIDVGQMLRSTMMRRALNTAVVVCLLLGLVVGAGYAVRSGFAGSRGQSLTSSSSNSGITESVLAYLGNGFDSVLGLFGHGKEVAMDGVSSSNVGNAASNSSISNSSSLDDNSAKSGNDNSSVGQGMAVVPSSGVAQSDDAAKKKIQDTFSDQVNIHPDQSGTAGVVTPIFKQAKGNGFIYVMVPVKGATTTP